MDDSTTQVLKELTQKLNNLEGYIATFHNIREQQLIEANKGLLATINLLRSKCERLEKQNDELRAEKLERLKEKHLEILKEKQ
jgi:hypothetical protein